MPKFDAVVHFAAIPRILITTDDECFRVNAMGTYTVIEAAVKLGIRKIIFASSETTYGVCFADGEVKPDYLPVDEDYDVCPQDSYAMSKVVNEAHRAVVPAPLGLRHLRAEDQQRHRARTIPNAISRAGWTTRTSAAATCSPISTPAIWRRWWIAA